MSFQMVKATAPRGVGDCRFLVQLLKSHARWESLPFDGSADACVAADSIIHEICRSQTRFHTRRYTAWAWTWVHCKHARGSPRLVHKSAPSHNQRLFDTFPQDDGPGRTRIVLHKCHPNRTLSPGNSSHWTCTRHRSTASSAPLSRAPPLSCCLSAIGENIDYT